MSQHTLHQELIRSVRQNRPQQVKALLEAGADPNETEDPDGVTPLHFAVIFNSPESAKLLIAAGANPDAENVDGLTALEMARGFNRTLIVNLLLRLTPR